MDTRYPPAFLTDPIAKAPVALSLTAVPEARTSHPLLTANARFWALTGFEAQHTIGRDLRCLQASTVQPHGRRRLGDALAAGRPVEAVLRNRHRGGTAYDMLMSIVPLPDREGAPMFFLCAHAVATEGRDAAWTRHATHVAGSFTRIADAWREHVKASLPVDPFLRDDPWRCVTARLAGFDVALSSS